MTHRLLGSPRATSVRTILLCALLTSGCIKRDGQAPDALERPEAGSSDAPLPAGVDVLGGAGITAFQVQGAAEKVSVQSVALTGAGFSQALQAEVKEESASEWSVQVQAKITEAVHKGDAMLATFHARVVKEQEDGGGETQFVFERASEPYTKSVTYSLRLTPEWREIKVRFVAGENHGPGEAQAIFRLGYEPETIQIANFKLENFKDTVSLGRLPTTEAADKRLAQKPAVAEDLPEIEGGELRLSVAPDKVIRSISPYVYGINSQNIDATGVTVRRNGGNRGSVYNWELNTSNAGND